MMNRVDAAWVAGIIEGEGCINVQRYDGVRARGARVVVAMTDEDVVRKLHAKTGIGSVRGPYAHSGKPAHHKPIWVWTSGGNRATYIFICAIHEFMGKRRGEKIMEIACAYGKELTDEERNAERDARVANLWKTRWAQKKAYPRVCRGCGVDYKSVGPRSLYCTALCRRSSQRVGVVA